MISAAVVLWPWETEPGLVLLPLYVLYAIRPDTDLDMHMQRIDPELLLSAFLPVLLFAGAFALHWHIVRKLIWSSLLLAGE